VRRYMRLLATPHLLVPLVATVIGALPLGMFSLGILFLLRSRTGSLADAGLGTGTFTIGNAVGLCAQGWLIERFGQTVVLMFTAPACAAWTVVLVLVSPTAGSIALALTACAGVGLVFPATIGSMRVLLGELVAEAADRAASYALLAVLFQLALLIGPVLASALLAPLGPGGVVLAAGGVTGTAGVSFALTRASRAWRPLVSRARMPMRRSTRTLLPLLLIAAGMGISTGIIWVAVPAAALAHGHAAESGPLMAMSSTGEIVSGFVIGACSMRLSAGRYMLLFLAGDMAAAFFTALVSVHVSWLFIAMLLSGACIGPIAVASSTLLDTLASKSALTRSYTLTVSIGLLGASLGSTLGGTIVESTGYRTAFAVNAFWLGVVLTVALAILRPVIR